MTDPAPAARNPSPRSLDEADGSAPGPGGEAAPTAHPDMTDAAAQDGRARLATALDRAMADAAGRRTATDGAAHAAPEPRLPPLARLPRLLLRAPILAYRYTLSSFMGRQCRYLPTCSDYADTAIARHGAWPGGWMVAARLCRCHPWGGHGFDPVPEGLPADGRRFRPWRYGVWRMAEQRQAEQRETEASAPGGPAGNAPAPRPAPSPSPDGGSAPP